MSKIEKLSKIRLVGMHGEKGAVQGLGGTPTRCPLRRKRQRRQMLMRAWEGYLVKYCCPCRSHLPMIRAREKL